VHLCGERGSARPVTVKCVVACLADDQVFSGDSESTAAGKNPTSYGACRNPLHFMVAGAGFEPATFGL
jgi:hypothetical protein